MDKSLRKFHELLTKWGIEMCGLLNPRDPFSAVLLYAINIIQIWHVKEPVWEHQFTLKLILPL